jgi:Domain of unknown function (DUF4252)
MKTRIFLIFLGLALQFQLFSQSKAFDKVFDTFAGKAGLLTLNISGNLLNGLFGVDENGNDFSLSMVKVLIVEDSTLNTQYNFYDQIVPELNKKEYEELMTVRNSDQKLVVLCKKQDTKITEFILVSGGSDNSLIYIKGSLSLDNLHKITQTISNPDKFRDPGNESRN